MSAIKGKTVSNTLSIVVIISVIALFNESSVENLSNRIVMIPMRDGIKLATSLYFPKSEDGPFPVILMRTPYNKEILKGYGDYFSGHGYILAAQDVRGRFESQGDWEPFINEGEDGYDTIEWLAVQDWSTGKIGMYGGSYSGSVQFAAAIRKPPHLVTLITNITPAMPFDNMPYEGGSLVMGGDIRWVDIVENSKTAADMQKKVREVFTRDWYSLLNHLPVIDLDKKILGKENPYWRQWIKHNTDDSYWENVSYLEELKQLDIPVFLQSGWFDPGNRGTKLAYSSLKQSRNKYIKMIMGPWEHTDQSSKYLYGQDLGEVADIGLMALYTKWFDYWLKGKDNGIINEPLVQVFNFGPNNWLKADTYPLPATAFTKFYMTSEKGANASRGDGKLQLQKSSSTKQFDTYIYDPGDPSPCFIDHLKKRALERYKNLVGSRKDILVYETAPLKQPLTIAGPISAILYASSSAKDTDWYVTLYAVAENGEISPIGMTWGVLRARYRNSMSTPEFLEKDRIYEFTVDLSHTGITFSKGERIRMEISSSSFPEYSRNLNTGGHNEMETEYVSATQRIYHTHEYPSHLVLPVIKMETLNLRPESSKKDEVTTDMSRYAPYIGQYADKLGDVKVFERNNKLAVDIPNKMVLTFNDPDEKGIWTCLLSSQVYLTFSKDNSGKVIDMNICQTISMPRKDDVEVSLEDVPEKYKPFVSKYLFQAINAEIEIIFQDGSLTLRDPDGDMIPLEFSEEKGIWEAEDKTLLIEFEYDEDGRVKEIKATYVAILHKK